MAERDEVRRVTVTYADGQTATFDTPNGWIRVREDKISTSTKDKRHKREFEVHWHSIVDVDL